MTCPYEGFNRTGSVELGSKLFSSFMLAALVAGSVGPAFARPDYTPARKPTREFIWTNARGLIASSLCRVSTVSEAAFAVVKPAEGGDSENFRVRGGKNGRELEIESKVVTNSLVKFVDGRRFDNYESVEVTGVHVEPDVRVRGKVAQRNEFGYIYDESLAPVSGYTFQITGEPALTNGSKYSTIHELNTSIVKAFLQPAMMGRRYLVYQCPNAKNHSERDEYLVFDLYLPGQTLSVARVGVGPDTSLFRHIRTYSSEAAAAAIIAEGTALLSDAAKNAIKSMADYAMQMYRKASGEEEVPAEEVVSEEDVEADDGIDYSQSDASDELADSAREDDVPVIFGQHEFRVCINSGPYRVRGLNAEGQIDTDNVLFEVPRFAIANPVQSFDGPSEKRQTVQGREMDFTLVKFPEVQGDHNIGWVSTEYVMPASHCATYQRSLGSSQPLVCIRSGDLKVYDVNSKGEFKSKDFRAAQFEEVAYRTDIDAETRTQIVDGKEVQYAPVVFLNQNNKIGWVAKKFIKTKGSCEPYKTAGTPEPGEEPEAPKVEGALFPSPGRPTASYIKGGPGAGKKYFGALRDGRLHAAVDLFRPFKDKVQAVMDGTVLLGPYAFYLGTYALEVKHSDGKVIRYGEVTGRLLSKKNVKKGDVITTVARNTSAKRSSMLHFEMYKGTKTGTLSGGGKYQRRSDLMDPTEPLRKWEKARFGKSW